MEDRSYKEKILLYGSLISVLAFLPFTIFRYMNGDYVIASLEAGLAVVLLFVFVYVWRTRRTEAASILACIIFLAVTVVIIHIKGPMLVYWLYPTTIASFCILNHRTASVLNLLALFFTFPAIYPTVSLQEAVVIYSTLSLLSLFGYIFRITNHNQHRELSQLAERDALTGTLNRRSLDENMLVAIKKYARNSTRKKSLIILDLDKFKEVNDTFGHSCGDQILIRIAQLIRANIRLSDQLFRYGGEEFVILVDNADIEEAETLAENIRLRVEKSNLFDRRRITISLGIAELDNGICSDEWLRLADDALYEAKRSGRNKVCLAKQDAQLVATAA